MTAVSEPFSAAPQAPEQAIEGKTPRQLFWERFRKDKAAIGGLITVLILILLAIFAPLIAKHLVGHCLLCAPPFWLRDGVECIGRGPLSPCPSSPCPSSAVESHAPAVVQHESDEDPLTLGVAQVQATQVVNRGIEGLT